MHAGVLARLELRADLQRALESGQFELHYQPIVRLADGRVSRAWRRCCAGATPSAGWWCPATSSRSPRRRG